MLYTYHPIKGAFNAVLHLTSRQPCEVLLSKNEAVHDGAQAVILDWEKDTVMTKPLLSMFGIDKYPKSKEKMGTDCSRLNKVERVYKKQNG